MSAVSVDLGGPADYRFAMTIAVQPMTVIPDLRLIRREARALKRAGGSMTYMQYLDQVARQRYGVRHYHEARRRAERDGYPAVSLSAAQHYLQSVQEYYLDF